jgi:hypothetical protein
MEEMHSLACVLSWRKEGKMPQVQIEEPDELQAHILAAIGYQIRDGSVLHVTA